MKIQIDVYFRLNFHKTNQKEVNVRFAKRISLAVHQLFIKKSEKKERVAPFLNSSTPFNKASLFVNCSQSVWCCSSADRQNQRKTFNKKEASYVYKLSRSKTSVPLLLSWSPKKPTKTKKRETSLLMNCSETKSAVLLVSCLHTKLKE